MIIGIHATLERAGAEDIDFFVHRYSSEQISPITVIVNGKSTKIGGNYDSVEKAFEAEVGKHNGYTPKNRYSVIFPK